jgi:Protein of unknown function (DUF3602)
MSGNVKKEPDQAPPPDLADLGTPTLKSKTYTTGRGGSGNMAVNDPEHPEFARERQDVDVPHVTLAAEKNFPTGRGRKTVGFLLVFLDSNLQNRRRWQYPQFDGEGTSRSKGTQSTCSGKQQRKGQLEGQRPSSRTGREG